MPPLCPFQCPSTPHPSPPSWPSRLRVRIPSSVPCATLCPLIQAQLPIATCTSFITPSSARLLHRQRSCHDDFKLRIPIVVLGQGGGVLAPSKQNVAETVAEGSVVLLTRSSPIPSAWNGPT